MALDLEVTIGLFIIFLIVLIGPFKVKTIERNLKDFHLRIICNEYVNGEAPIAFEINCPLKWNNKYDIEGGTMSKKSNVDN